MDDYLPRHAYKGIDRCRKMFGAVLVNGPRQVGKTTMLSEYITGLDSSVNFVALDDSFALMTALDDPKTFFADNEPPVFIDEIQKAPVLFPEIKLILDRSHLKGQFYMCGSQQFRMMKNVSESLAGRIGLVTLLGFSLRELYGIDFEMPFIPTEEYFAVRKPTAKNISCDDVWMRIWRGSFPELSLNTDYDWRTYYSAYVNTYVERDVRELTAVGDTVKFTNFMTAVAASTGQLLNLSSMARDVGISEPTAQRWLSVLVASSLVYLLQPYSNNITKRAVKTPKLYFLDTGLAAYLTRWNTPDVLKSGAMAGAFFETFVVTEIIKSYYNQGYIDLPFYFYRDKDMKEIDLLIEENGTLYPLEIKRHATPQASDVSAFHILDRIPEVKRGTGGVICLYDRLASIKGERVIPISFL